MSSRTQLVNRSAVALDRGGPRIWAAGVAALLVAFALMASSALAAGGYAFATKWGSAGSGDGQFSNPERVAVDGSGNVYITDAGNDRVQKFGSTGTFVTKWGSTGTGDGQFIGPFGVAVDGSGNVYVADAGSNRVEKFGSTGTFVTKWGSFGSGNGQFSEPIGVAVDGSGNVYVADLGNNRVQKFDSTGTFETKWGSLGSGDGQFNAPTGVAVDGSGNVYVADEGNDRVEKFDSTGTFSTKWGSTGTGDGQFNGPSDVAVDGSGNVYITDFRNDRVEKFDSSGNFLTKFGSVGSGDGQFDGPSGVAIDGSGNVYVVDRDNNRVQKFAPGYAPAVLADNPVGYWRFGESSGTTAHDSAGANDGTYLGGFRLGQHGIAGDDTAVGLDGLSGYVRVPDSTSLHTGDTFSLEAWVKRDYLSTYNGTEGLFAKGYQVYLDGGQFGTAGTLVLRKPNVQTIARSTIGITDRSFHHVVVTKSGPSVHLYIDGTDVTGTVSNRTITDTTTPLQIGNGATRTLRGTLDETAVYNYALTPAQVAAHFAAGH